MLKGRDILVFANNWDADNHTSSHHIAGWLARDNRLLYVESGGLRSPNASARDLGRVFSKIVRFLRGSRRAKHARGSFDVISLLLIPMHRIASVRRVNEFLVGRTIRYFLWRLRFRKPIVIFFFPHVHYLCGGVPDSFNVYYCIDDYSAFPGVDTDEIRRMDDLLTAKADVVFAVSESVAEAKRSMNPRVFHSPHGVDLEHFDLTRELPVPEQLAALGSGRMVLYWGLVADWMDLDLVEHLVRQHPAVSFVFLGASSVPLERFRAHTNIRFLGPVPYADLPAYGKRASALILPFKKNAWTQSINPIKLREYLATDKPVISTDIPEAVRLATCVWLARNKEEFSAHLGEIVRDVPTASKGGRDFVRDMSWEHRAAEVGRRIEALLGER